MSIASAGVFQPLSGIIRSLNLETCPDMSHNRCVDFFVIAPQYARSVETLRIVTTA